MTDLFKAEKTGRREQSVGWSRCDREGSFEFKKLNAVDRPGQRDGELRASLEFGECTS